MEFNSCAEPAESSTHGTREREPHLQEATQGTQAGAGEEMAAHKL